MNVPTELYTQVIGEQTIQLKILALQQDGMQAKIKELTTERDELLVRIGDKPKVVKGNK